MLLLQSCGGSLTVRGSCVSGSAEDKHRFTVCVIALHIVPSGTDSQLQLGAQPLSSSFDLQDVMTHDQMCQDQSINIKCPGCNWYPTNKII